MITFFIPYYNLISIYYKNNHLDRLTNTSAHIVTKILQRLQLAIMAGKLKDKSKKPNKKQILNQQHSQQNEQPLPLKDITLSISQLIKKVIEVRDVQLGAYQDPFRVCRDQFFCLFFFVCLSIMIYSTFYGLSNGNVQKIFRGITNDGIVCGQVNGVAEEYPYLYFYNPTINLQNSYCVKKCPYYNETKLTKISYYSSNETSGPACTSYNVTVYQNGSFNGTPSTKMCVGYASELIVQRVCLPENYVLQNAFNQIMDTFSKKLQIFNAFSIANDLQNHWLHMFWGAGLSLIVPFILGQCLKCATGPIIWICTVCSILFWGALGLFFMYHSGNYSIQSGFGFLGWSTYAGYQNYTWYAYGCFGLAAIIILINICCFSRIKVAVALCKVACYFVAQISSVWTFAIGISIVFVGLFAFLFFIGIYILSCAEFSSDGDSVFTQITDFTSQNMIRFYCLAFATLMMMNFMRSVSIFTIASSCCFWYYESGQKYQVEAPISRSLRRAFRYHLGSLFFGSVILVVLGLFQIVFEMIKMPHEKSKYYADKNKSVSFITKILNCCLNFFEIITKRINHLAYIQIALRGKSFIEASKDGFQISLNNNIRYSAVIGTSRLVACAFRRFTVVLTTVGFYAFISLHQPLIIIEMFQPLCMLIIILLVSYGVSTFFASIFSVSIDTIITCFIGDQMNQIAKGQQTALYGPIQITDILDELEERLDQ